MVELKRFKTYAEQVGLLVSRGMVVEDEQRAADYLARLNYYRLSGYWHTMRRVDPSSGKSLNEFQPGASFDTVIALYEFDERLRNATFAALAPVEVAMRALLGYELGRIDPLTHMDPNLLGAPARQPRYRGSSVTTHQWWLERFTVSMSSSKEEFVAHHAHAYQKQMPIWVAVEVMDWGQLSYLYRMAPSKARNRIAARCDLSAPQLESWLKTLNVLRNLAAHQARLFNRSFDIKPKLSDAPSLQPIVGRVNRIFGQLTLAQYLHHKLDLAGSAALSEVLASYPYNPLVPFSRLGASTEWTSLELWCSDTAD